MNPFKVPLEKLIVTVKLIKPQLIDAIGVEALHFIDNNFKRQGFAGETFIPWDKRKKNDKVQRKILVLTGTLRRSFVKTDSENFTTISSDVPYAQVHNEGGIINRPSRGAILNYTGINGKLRLAKTQTEYQQRRITAQRTGTIAAGTIKMPQRQMIGKSPVLTQRCQKVLVTRIKDQLLS